jgi:hypothetical protein
VLAVAGEERMKYMLRTRLLDSEPWGEPLAYKSRLERDRNAAMMRIYGGFRTHSYDVPSQRKSVRSNDKERE